VTTIRKCRIGLTKTVFEGKKELELMKRNLPTTFRLFLTVIAISLAATCIPSSKAQSSDAQTPADSQMQKRLDQLEQEVRDLKKQMAKDEQEKANGANQPPAVAAELTTATKSEPGDEKPIPKSTVDIYGFAMTDGGYRSGAVDPNWFDVMRPTKMESFRGQFAPNGSTYFSVRQTRFGVKSSMPTAFGDLKTIFEFELFGTGVDAGQTTFRLRHAYGELGHFGAGQTWSPFMDIDVFPNSLEYWGPNGMVFFRNVQVRWMPIQGDSRVTIALERPGASADGGVYADRVELQNIRPQFKWPDLSGQARLARSWGYVQAAAILRKIAWVDLGGNATNLSGGAIGWGFNVSSNLRFTSKDTGRFSVVYGAGVQNYMNDAPNDVGVKNNFANTVSPIKGVALPMLGLVSFLDHNWSDRFSTAIGYSMLNIENSNGQKPSDFHQGHYALTNLLYHPVKPVTIGGEFQFGRRVNFSDGFNVNDYKVQFSFKYDWAKGFAF
jgi:hypothetical protein